MSCSIYKIREYLANARFYYTGKDCDNLLEEKHLSSLETATEALENITINGSDGPDQWAQEALDKISATLTKEKKT